MDDPLPATQAPALSFPCTDGSTWTLADQQPENFTLVVFYRGLHCPVCKSYTKQLQSLRADFSERGVEVVAVSMDDAERAEQTVDAWGLDDLPVGHGLSEADVRRWGLYLSEGIKEPEPALFSEPGLFLVRPDGTLYYAAVNSMPFGRPALDDFLGALDFILENDYPPRGEASKTQPG